MSSITVSIDSGDPIEINVDVTGSIINRPEVFFGTGDPPTAVGKMNGTLFFKYEG